jgi:hypothetical protein
LSDFRFLSGALSIDFNDKLTLEYINLKKDSIKLYQHNCDRFINLVIEIDHEEQIKLFRLYEYPPKKRIVSEFLYENFNLGENIVNFSNIFSHIFVRLKKDDELYKFIAKLDLSSNDVIPLDLLVFEQIDYKHFINKNLTPLLKKLTDQDQIFSYYHMISINENFHNTSIIDTYSHENKKIIKEGFLYLKVFYLYPHRLYLVQDKLVQTSRFLRKYFDKDNFILLSFIDQDMPIKSSNNNDFEDKLFTLVLEKGFKILNDHYVFFFISTSRMRKSSCWLVSTQWMKKMNKTICDLYSELGYDLLKPEMSISLKIARMSLNFTNTLEIILPNLKVEVVKDIVREYEGKKYVFNDGVGMISKNIMESCCAKHNKGSLASAIQIRFNYGVKGVLVLSKIIPENTIIFTDSMIKFSVDDSSKSLEIIKFSKFSQGFLNKNIILNLKFMQINRTSKKLSKLILKYTKKLLNKQLERKIRNTDLDSFDEALNLHFKKNSLINLKRNFRIFLNKSANLMGVVDFLGVLEEGEVFIQINKRNQIKKLKGEVLITRNPCWSKYDIQKFTCVYREELSHLTDVIVFSSKGNIPSAMKMSNSDYDGDIFMVIYDRKIVRLIKTFEYNSNEQANTDIQVYKSKNSESSIQSFNKDMFEYFSFVNKNDKIGSLCKEYFSEGIERLEYTKYLHKIATACSMEVDFPKQGKTVNIQTSPAKLQESLKFRYSEYNFLLDFVYEIDKSYINYYQIHSSIYLHEKDLLNNFLRYHQDLLQSKISINKKKYTSYKPMNEFDERKFFDQISNIYDLSSFVNLCFFNELKKLFNNDATIDHKDYSSKLDTLKIFFEDKGKLNHLDKESLISKISFINKNYNDKLKNLMKKYKIYFEEDLFQIYVKSTFSKFFKDKEEFIKIINFSFENIQKETLKEIKNLDLPNEVIVNVSFLLNHYLPGITIKECYSEINHVISVNSEKNNSFQINSKAEFSELLHEFSRNYFDIIRPSSFYFIIKNSN